MSRLQKKHFSDPILDKCNIPVCFNGNALSVIGGMINKSVYSDSLHSHLNMRAVTRRNFSLHYFAINVLFSWLDGGEDGAGDFGRAHLSQLHPYCGMCSYSQAPFYGIDFKKYQYLLC